jgi:hypothetical protein
MLLDSTTKIRSNLKPYYFVALLSTLFFSNVSLLYAECKILQFQNMHSQGLNVSNNRCSSATDLSLESIIEMQGGARLWLETSQSSQNVTHYQIVCQNQSPAPTRIKLTSPNSPWVTPIDFTNCSNWVTGRLTCNAPGQQEAALLCVIAEKPENSAVYKIQLKTSLTMRGIKPKTETKPAIETSKWADFAKPNVGLCRIIVNSNQAVRIQWTIKASTGKVSSATVLEPPTVDRQFAACALEAVENTHFPTVPYDVSLSSTF